MKKRSLNIDKIIDQEKYSKNLDLEKSSQTQIKVLSRKEQKSLLFNQLIELRNEDLKKRLKLLDHYEILNKKYQNRYSDHLLEKRSYLNSFKTINAQYDKTSKKLTVDLSFKKYFDKKLTDDPRLFLVGEDIGKLGGVNLEFEGLQEQHGQLRVTDTGIREASILGQAYGAAMRGLRPVADIQYLDYLIYALQGLSDDVATLRYRTSGGQAAPLIIRTKGHRLEGIWHTGSPL